MKTKKLLSLLVAGAMALTLAACAAAAKPDTAQKPAATATQAPVTEAAEAPEALDSEIAVISREDGSGTRGAFIELFGVEQKDANGNKVDHTTEDADVTNSTSVMLQSVAGNADAIGYVSLGSMNDTVKALAIDGADATVDNIKAGTYKIARPFNIVTRSTISEAARAFIDFILSQEGQAVIEANGYIASVEGAASYAGNSIAGKVVVAGSSSVTPVMEKLKEAYLALNPNAEIEVQQSDSSTGVNMAIDGSCDIGMASRELKDSETEKGVSATVIAIDGIAVIVNLKNPVDALTSEQVRTIYVGEVTNWSEVG